MLHKLHLRGSDFNIIISSIIEENVIYLTVNVNVRREPIFSNLYLECGVAEWSMHVNDCHWFKLSESPTNKMRLFLYLLKKVTPLNLHKQNFNWIIRLLIAWVSKLELIIFICSSIWMVHVTSYMHVLG